MLPIFTSKHFDSLCLSSDLPDGLWGFQRRFDRGRPEPLQHSLSFTHKLVTVAHKLSVSHSGCDHDGTPHHHHLCCRLFLCQVRCNTIRAAYSERAINTWSQMYKTLCIFKCRNLFPHKSESCWSFMHVPVPDHPHSSFQFTCIQFFYLFVYLHKSDYHYNYLNA